MKRKILTLIFILLLLTSNASIITGNLDKNEDEKISTQNSIPIHDTNMSTDKKTSKQNNTLKQSLNYESIDPIKIKGNTDFESTAEKNNWNGNGTVSNPYIIEGYNINGGDMGYCISITNVTLHFVIKDCFIHGTLSVEGSGIILKNVSNSLIKNSLISNNKIAIKYKNVTSSISKKNELLDNEFSFMILESKAINVSQCNINTIERGVSIINSKHIMITNCNITDKYSEKEYMHTYGIRLSHSSFNLIKGNIVNITNGDSIFVGESSNNIFNSNIILKSEGYGLALIFSSNNNVKNCTLTNCAEAIEISHSLNNLILNCTINNNEENGISIEESINITLKENNLKNCGIKIGLAPAAEYKNQNPKYWTSHQIDKSNIVNGRPVFYWKNKENRSLPNEANQAILVNCSNIRIENRNFIGKMLPLQIIFSTNIDLINISFKGNSMGGVLQYQTNNVNYKNCDFWNNSFGIKIVASSNYTSICNSTFVSNWDGLVIRGRSDTTLVSDCFFKGNYDDIFFWETDNNTLVRCSFYDGVEIKFSDNISLNRCDFNGGRIVHFFNSKNSDVLESNVSDTNLEIESSTNITLSKNRFKNGGLILKGNKKSHWISHTVNRSNYVNNHPIVYLKSLKDKSIQTSAGQIILVNCTGIKISDQKINKTSTSVQLGYSNGCTIKNCEFKSNNRKGILLHNSKNNSILNCNISNNWKGIKLNSNSNDNVIQDIYFYSNYHHSISMDGTGVLIKGSNNNLIKECNIKKSSDGIYIEDNSEYNTVKNIYIEESGYGIAIEYSSNNTINGCMMKDNEYGIHIYNGHNNSIIKSIILESKFNGIVVYGNKNSINESTIKNSYVGIRLRSTSLYNRIISCEIISNDNIGLEVGSSSYNIIYHNNFIDNTRHAKNNPSPYGENIWDNGPVSGGNYWDDYEGEDTEGDGIGDSPYNIPSGPLKDRYPLMYRFEEDDEKPVLEINKPVDGSSISSKKINVSWDGTDDNKINLYSVKIDDKNWISVKKQSSYEIDNLTEGDHELTIRGTDSGMNRAIKSINFTIDLTDPVAKIESVDKDVEIGNTTIKVDEKITFDASNSSDNEEIVKYMWDFDDGANTSGKSVEHKFGEKGTYEVKLTVIDEAGNMDTDTVTIKVEKKNGYKIPAFTIFTVILGISLVLIYIYKRKQS